METTNKWSVRDVITLVLMTVLLIVMQLGVNMICMVNHFVSMVLSVGITMLLCGPVYFLMVNRIRKRFVSLVYMTLLGVAFLLMGSWFLLPWFVLVGGHRRGHPLEGNYPRPPDRRLDGIQPAV